MQKPITAGGRKHCFSAFRFSATAPLSILGWWPAHIFPLNLRLIHSFGGWIGKWFF